MSIHRALLAVVLSASAVAVAADIPMTSSMSLLVLRNGYVLHGQIVPLGDHYLVVQSDADQIRIPVGRVEMVCSTLEEAYLRKRDVIARGDVRSHLVLAGWCLRHRLHARAADQILAAYAIDPGNPRIVPLKKQLQSASRPSQAGPSEPATPPSQLALPAPAARLTSESIQQFTGHVQPLLLNRCASGACHSGGSMTAFKLSRPPVGQPVSSRLTQRNLLTVLQHVHQHSPSESPLLTVPRRPHGGLDQPVLGAADIAQIRVLLKWIRELPDSSQSQPPSAHPPDPDTLLQRADRSPPPGPAKQTPDAHNGEADEYVPRDPFDAEVFNRQ